MALQNYTYLLLNVLTLVGPLSRSFEPRVKFRDRWFALLPAIFVTAILFVGWDILFTREQVWGFNPRYLIGIQVLGLPVEEWLFFVTVPYACVFMYDCLNYFWSDTMLNIIAVPLAAVLLSVTATLALTYWDHLYTAVTCGTASVCMGWAVWKRPPFLGRFFRGYLIALIPFLLVNGVLTGGVTQAPIVWYDDTENLGVRLGTIPVDDVFYLLSLLWLVIAQYERRLQRHVAPLNSSLAGKERSY